MNILQALCLMASPGEDGGVRFPDVWSERLMSRSPERWEWHKAPCNFNLFNAIWYGADWVRNVRIIAKGFHHLVEEVRENPVDNAAVRAFFKDDLIDVGTKMEYGEVCVFDPQDDKPIGYIDQSLHVEGVNGYSCLPDSWDILRQSGYAPGVPEELLIRPSEVEKLENK